MKNIIVRTNEYGGSIVACEKHMPKHIKNLLGKIFTEKIDNSKTCEDCRQEQRNAEAPERAKKALLDSKCVHTRWRKYGVSIYHRDNTSPSGVILAASIDEERFNILYDELIKEEKISSSLSPLSPTEMLYKS